MYKLNLWNLRNLAPWLIVLGCSGAYKPTTTAKKSQLSQLPLCSTATPDDGLDDTLAVQLAINTRCCLGPGVHDIDTPPQPPVGRRVYNMLTVGTTGELCGVGPTTVIHFRGDAGLQDWRGVEVLGGSVHDVTLSTGSLTNTGEQTHAIHATGPVAGAKVHDVVFDHPIRGALPGGDCIDLVGYAPAQLITDFIVRDNIFLHCDRGGVQSHSGTVRLTVDRNQFLDTGDVDINSEGLGGSTDWTITRNTFAASPSNQGAYSVALDLIDGVSFTDNVLARGLYLYSCSNCAITRNTILASSGHSSNGGTIEALKASNNLTIADNTITRTSLQDVGPVIHVGPHGTQASLDVRISHNTIEQQTLTDVIYTEGVTGLRIDDNLIKYTPITGIASGLRCMGSGTMMTNSVSLANNTFTGSMRSAVYIAGALNRANVGSLTAIWNTSAAQGLLCENLTGITGPLLLSRNTWPTGSCGVPSIAVTVP